MKDKVKLHSLSDEELMTYYQAGEYHAFEILYLRHSGKVYAYLKKKVSADKAADLMQETFEKLHRSRDKYNHQFPFLPWLFTISKNTLFDWFKKNEAKVEISSVLKPELLEGLMSAEKKQDAEIDILLNDLEGAQKNAIELRYLQEWSFEKIAKEMNTTEDNVRQIISRGIKKLRLQFAEKGDEG